MTQLYKDGFMEAVVFLFFKGGKILVEIRPKGKGKEVFIPNGAVEQEDSENGDYLIKAMNREVEEEFQGNVTITKYEYLTSYKVNEIKINFHAFLVTEWKGNVPDFTVENGEKFADLKWINLSDYRKHLELPSAVHICQQLETRLENSSDS